MHAPRSSRTIVTAVAIVVLAAAYVALRFEMNVEYAPASWRSLVELQAPLPFGHRVLVPWLARPWVGWGVPIHHVFAGFELVSVVGLIVALATVLPLQASTRARWALAVAFVFVLAFAYLLPHRWPIFYPWDTPAMVVVGAGVGLVLRRRYGWATIVVALGAANRESAIVVPLATLLVHLGNPTELRKAAAWSGLMLVGFVIVRHGITLALPDNPGASLHFTVDGRYRVFNNLQWLADPWHAAQFVGSLGMLPVLWVLLWSHIPVALRRLHLPALLLVLGLMVVGNAYEPRAFGEALVLSWMAISAGLVRWLGEDEPCPPADEPGWLRRLDRTGAMVLLLAFIAVVLALDR